MIQSKGNILVGDPIQIEDLSERVRQIVTYTVDDDQVITAFSIDVIDPSPAIIPYPDPPADPELTISFPAMVLLGDQINIEVTNNAIKLYLKINNETWKLGTDASYTFAYTTTQIGTNTVKGLSNSGDPVWEGSFEVYQELPA